MSENQLSPAQEDEIARIKTQWMAEAEPYLNDTPQKTPMLDGSGSAVLAQIQEKYKLKIKKVMEGI